MSKYPLILCFQFIFFGLLGQQASNIDSSFQNLVTKYENVGVSAAYAVNGETKWTASKGYANAALKTEFNENTRTRIASITKPFTAICIMQLVEKGNLKLDDEIHEYIPDYPQKSESKITIRQLLTHTSGIDGYKNTKEATTTTDYPTLEEATKIFRDRKLKFEPGTEYLYTTYGYVVLGLIIEKVSGQTYEEYIQEHILDIVGMNNTGVEKYGKIYPGKSSIYHMEKGNVIAPEVNNLSNRIPAGGLYATVVDLIKFGNAVMNNSLITEASLNEMLKIGFPQEKDNPYGLGWFLYGPKESENQFIGHGGGQFGANTQLMLIPKLKATIVVLSNTSETPNSNIIRFSVEVLEKILIENKK